MPSLSLLCNDSTSTGFGPHYASFTKLTLGTCQSQLLMARSGPSFFHSIVRKNVLRVTDDLYPAGSNARHSLHAPRGPQPPCFGLSVFTIGSRRSGPTLQKSQSRDCPPIRS